MRELRKLSPSSLKFEKKFRDLGRRDRRINNLIKLYERLEHVPTQRLMEIMYGIVTLLGALYSTNAEAKRAIQPYFQLFSLKDVRNIERMLLETSSHHSHKHLVGGAKDRQDRKSITTDPEETGAGRGAAAAGRGAAAAGRDVVSTMATAVGKKIIERYMEDFMHALSRSSRSASSYSYSDKPTIIGYTASELEQISRLTSDEAARVELARELFNLKKMELKRDIGKTEVEKIKETKKMSEHSREFMELAKTIGIPLGTGRIIYYGLEFLNESAQKIIYNLVVSKGLGAVGLVSKGVGIGVDFVVGTAASGVNYITAGYTSLPTSGIGAAEAAASIQKTAVESAISDIMDAGELLGSFNQLISILFGILLLMYFLTSARTKNVSLRPWGANITFKGGARKNSSGSGYRTAVTMKRKSKYGARRSHKAHMSHRSRNSRNSRKPYRKHGITRVRSRSRSRSRFRSSKNNRVGNMSRRK
jgi:microcompartment protein CcmL/EutN